MAHSEWYVAAMERLVAVVQDLSQARDLESITEIVRRAARSLTGADGATFVLRDGDLCYYVDEDAIVPLWKGRKFPIETCISGWSMLNAEPAVIEDIYQDERIPQEAYRPTFVKSLVMVPIRRSDPIGAIGNYWANRRRPTEDEVRILQTLADTTSVALENARLYGDLKQHLQRLEAQETRILAQRDSLEVFTRALAHDLKEPIRTIRAFIELIDSPNDAERSTEYFQFIKSAADRMGILIDTVFRYTQLDDPTLTSKEKCSMQEAIGGARENLALLIRDSHAVITDGDLPDVQANVAQMIQLWQNLIANAIRHANKPVHMTIDSQRQSDNWIFSVADDGPGIASEFLESIFQPFKRLTRRDDCSGLGLAACRKIVEAHGGKIWCESQVGKGATFFFTLPRVDDDKTKDADSRSEHSASQDRSDSKVANVLLVDDREDDVELTKLMLFNRVGLNCNLKVAYDGDQTLEILHESLYQRDPINLVLLDINMPGMDGFEVMKRIRQSEALQNTPIVMCTGSNYEKDKQRAKLLGAVGYLEKPPALDRLKEIVTDIDSVAIQYDGKSQMLLQTT